MATRFSTVLRFPTMFVDPQMAEEVSTFLDSEREKKIKEPEFL